MENLRFGGKTSVFCTFQLRKCSEICIFRFFFRIRSFLFFGLVCGLFFETSIGYACGCPELGVKTLPETDFYAILSVYLVFRNFLIFPKPYPNRFFSRLLLWETDSGHIFPQAAAEGNPMLLWKSCCFRALFSKGCGNMSGNVEKRNFGLNLRTKKQNIPPFSAKSKHN